MATDDAMARALRLQREAAGQGFDWAELDPVWDKLQEEIGELREVAGDPRRAREELGDLLFMVVNLARHLGLDPAEALRAANRKFERRYPSVITDAAALPPVGDPARLVAMEARWQAAKRAETRHDDGGESDD